MHALVSPCLSEVRQSQDGFSSNSGFEGVTKSSRYIPTLGTIGQHRTPRTKAHASMCVCVHAHALRAYRRAGLKEVRSNYGLERGINRRCFVSVVSFLRPHRLRERTDQT